MRPLSSFSTKTEPEISKAQKDKIVRQEITDTSQNLPPQPSDYLDELDGEDMSEAQKIEYLTIIFNVMKCFVTMGFGANSIPRLIPETGGNARVSASNPICLEHSKHRKTFNNIALTTGGAAKES